MIDEKNFFISNHCRDNHFLYSDGLCNLEVKKIENPRNSIEITVYDWNNKPYPFVLGSKNPGYVSWKNISPHIKWAVILSEDAKFYRHHGVDYEAIKRHLRKISKWGSM